MHQNLTSRWGLELPGPKSCQLVYVCIVHRYASKHPTTSVAH